MKKYQLGHSGWYFFCFGSLTLDSGLFLTIKILRKIKTLKLSYLGFAEHTVSTAVYH